MLTGILIMGGLGAICGLGLALASKIFYVYVDPKIEAVSAALPGANCGGCGFAGCGANAEAIVAGRSTASSCVAGGPDVAEEIARILGVSVEAKEPDFARPGCTYGFQDADQKYLYSGIKDCRAAFLLHGGSKVCPIGCLGLGTCVSACPFGALSIGPDNLPVVDTKKCTGCGTCERICPKHIITLSSGVRRIEREYRLDECTAPCQRACPAGIEIPLYIKKIKEGDYSGALSIIKQTNPLPLVCGRICVHPCEDECRRNLADEPVAINYLKRFAADYEMKSGKRVQIPRAPATGKKVAVVGGGAEGLTAAYFLNRMGHEVVLYEGSGRLGGLLRTGIAENRLPQDVLDYEIDGILEAGVEAKLNQRLGRDFTVASILRDGFRAVLVALGGWDSQMPAKNRDKTLPGVELLVDFMLGNGPSRVAGRHVTILGGGTAALKAAADCARKGAASVRLVFRKPRAASPYSEARLAGIEELGVQLHFERAITRMMGEGESLTHLEMVRISEHGVADKEGDLIPTDLLLIGAGRFPELIYVKRDSASEGQSSGQVSLPWESLPPYAGPFAAHDIGIFRPGEALADYKAVVEAIGAGRRGAASVNMYLTGREVAPPPKMVKRGMEVLTVKELQSVEKSPRHPMPQSSREERLSNPLSEIELGYTEEQARAEAARCLQCGLICYRRLQSPGEAFQ
jgi:NADPH-dependent glutamate synthase beta subunit-like oxidoreductase